ncbi:glucokinase [Apiospora marii]|uniref:Phosphotransferase n=1 Tax=Apiospora marii TaxID=335849 RepID=A0ABR1RCE5_9PEZI
MAYALLDHAQRLAETFELSDKDIQRCSEAFIDELTLGVDLGGTNLRVCSVELHGDTTSTVLQWKLPVPPYIMVCDKAERLFSFIANSVRDFLGAHHPSHLGAAKSDSNTPRMSLGFTFSFPAYQAALDSGILLRWTKGFDIPDAVNQDVCILLQKELDVLQLPVKVTALVNDAVGTIMARAYSLPPSHVRPTVGAIFGTGTNGVYLQALNEVTKPIELFDKTKAPCMFTSTEWGSFDNQLAVLPVTPYDTELDNFSVNPGDQMFEKRVSGMFLGELLRLAVLDMCSRKGLRVFGGFPLHDTALGRRWSVDSSIISVAEADSSTALVVLRHKISHTFGIPEEHVTTADAEAVKLIAHGIGTRAARLSGMAVGSVITQGRLLDGNGVAAGDAGGQGGSRVDVAVDGSVIEHYAGFEAGMRSSLKVLDGIGEAGERSITIGHAQKGSSVGAAIVALLASEDG